MKFKMFIAAISFALTMASSPLMAEDTSITVRVLSKDAKFIGSSVGGARVILRDKETGEVLAQGVTAGGTGNTAKIMHKNSGRRAGLADESAASFETILNLDRPRLIEAEVYGPLAQPQATHAASATQWVIPGGHLSAGDGWVIVLPGLIVNVMEPAATQKVSIDNANNLTIRANVMMMCGCPITPDGLWDANQFEIAMTVIKNGKKIAEQKMFYTGESSMFEGKMPVREPGVYQIIVHAYDPENGNTGVDKTTVSIE